MNPPVFIQVNILEELSIGFLIKDMEWRMGIQHQDLKNQNIHQIQNLLKVLFSNQ